MCRAREGAQALRDVISAEMWEAINTTHLRLRDGDLSPRRGCRRGRNVKIGHGRLYADVPPVRGVW